MADPPFAGDQGGLYPRTPAVEVKWFVALAWADFFIGKALYTTNVPYLEFLLRKNFCFSFSQDFRNLCALGVSLSVSSVVRFSV
jgi:hypothetical protein